MADKRSFYCSQCDLYFKAEASRYEYHDPILGACWRWQAECPECGAVSKENKKPLTTNPASSNKGSDVNAVSSCATGTCPFV